MTGYRGLAIPGAMTGLLLIVGGFVLMLSQFSQFLPAELSQSSLLVSLPHWAGVSIFMAGVLTYSWGQGLLQGADWSPFFVALYLFHFGLYLALFITCIVYAGKLPLLPAPTALFSITGVPPGTVEGMILGLLGFGLALGFLLSRGLWQEYEQKYANHSKLLAIFCPNPDCRVRLPQVGSRCTRCDPEVLVAQLVLADDEREHYTLRFTPDNEQWKISRYDIGQPHQSCTIYLNPDKNVQYEHLSVPHAAIGFDGKKDEFYIVDLNSLNKTYVNEQQVQQDRVPLSENAELELGGVRFSFQFHDEDEAESAHKFKS